MKNNNSLITVKEQVSLRIHRFKRQCGCGCCAAPSVIAVCCKGVGQKEMFRNWWLHIPLLLLPTSISWIKALFF
uniref:Uncharacterized protein n=1 Tax=Onchocerca volvulus TaxID=6282 RepID=A0A8R1TPC1_ONCVO